jgi:hypothetical protein
VFRGSYDLTGEYYILTPRFGIELFKESIEPFDMNGEQKEPWQEAHWCKDMVVVKMIIYTD